MSLTRLESMQKRRSYYDLGDDVKISDEQIADILKEQVALTPDAFNMQSARAVVLLGKEHKKLWNIIDESFAGKVSAEKIASFAKAYGTVLYYIDTEVVDGLKQQFPPYAHNFDIWANQANGMLQFNVWTALREVDLGASLQHYNPVIDENIAKEYNIPSSWKLVAQMPFGTIESEPAPKPEANADDRVVIHS